MGCQVVEALIISGGSDLIATGIAVGSLGTESSTKINSRKIDATIKEIKKDALMKILYLYIFTYLLSGQWALHSSNNEEAEGSSDSDTIPSGTWVITRPDGTKAEIHSGHTHYDKDSKKHEDPHTHERPQRDPRDPKSEKNPDYKEKEAHKTTSEEKKIWKDQYGK
jgi:hypothetical protein